MANERNSKPDDPSRPVTKETDDALRDHGSKIAELLRLAAKADTEDKGKSATADGDPEVDRETLEKELERRVKEAFLFYEQKFSTLPSVSRLRELWKERKIDENDPIWLMTDVLALYDARGQIALQQIVRILRACQDLNQFTIAEMRRALDMAAKVQLAAEEMNAKADAVMQHMQAFAGMLSKYEKQFPVLLNAMYKVTNILDTRNKAAVYELAAIVAGATLLGGGGMYALMKWLG